MHSKLRLSTQVKRGCTYLDGTAYCAPIKLMSLPHQDDGILRVVQMSSSPGLMGGDVIEAEITLAPFSCLRLYTQAFTRVLQMNAGDKACQHTHIHQHINSSLLYLPHPLVLHADSTLEQQTVIDLDDNCELLYGEIVAVGRVLCDEKFAFHRFSSHLTICHQNKTLVSDNTQWQPSRYRLDVVGQLENYTHQLTVFYVHTGLDKRQIDELVNRLFDELDEVDKHSLTKPLLWGVSRAGECVLCLRALAHTAQDLQKLVRIVAMIALKQESLSPTDLAFLV